MRSRKRQTPQKLNGRTVAQCTRWDPLGWGFCVDKNHRSIYVHCSRVVGRSGDGFVKLQKYALYEFFVLPPEPGKRYEMADQITLPGGALIPLTPKEPKAIRNLMKERKKRDALASHHRNPSSEPFFSSASTSEGGIDCSIQSERDDDASESGHGGGDSSNASFNESDHSIDAGAEQRSPHSRGEAGEYDPRRPPPGLAGRKYDPRRKRGSSKAGGGYYQPTSQSASHQHQRRHGGGSRKHFRDSSSKPQRYNPRHQHEMKKSRRHYQQHHHQGREQHHHRSGGRHSRSRGTREISTIAPPPRMYGEPPENAEGHRRQLFNRSMQRKQRRREQAKMQTEWKEVSDIEPEDARGDWESQDSARDYVNGPWSPVTEAEWSPVQDCAPASPPANEPPPISASARKPLASQWDSNISDEPLQAVQNTQTPAFSETRQQPSETNTDHTIWSSVRDSLWSPVFSLNETTKPRDLVNNQQEKQIPQECPWETYQPTESAWEPVTKKVWEPVITVDHVQQRPLQTGWSSAI